MKVWKVGMAVIAGITLGSIQGLGGSSAEWSFHPAMTAQAAGVVTEGMGVDNSVKAPGLLGTCPWYLTTDGVLHVESGTLPMGNEVANRIITCFSQIQSREDNNGYELKIISFDGEVKAPTEAANLFDFSQDLLTGEENPLIRNWANLNTSQVTDFSNMFTAYRREPVDVSELDTRNAENMDGMFSYVQQVDGIEKLNTSQVTSMKEMFEGYGDDTGEASLDLSDWDVSNVKKGGFDKMLDVNNLRSVNLSGWRPQVTLKGIFFGTDPTQIRQITLNPKIKLTDSGLSGPNPEHWGDESKYTGKWENINDQYIKDEDHTKKTTYTTEELVAQYDGNNTLTENATYIWEPNTTPGNPVTVHYIDQDGKIIQADKQVPGDYDADYDITPDMITGYDYVGVESGSLQGTYDSDPKEVTLTYKKVEQTTGGNQTSAEPDVDSSNTTSGTTPDTDNLQNNSVAKKNRAITAVKKIGLYRTPNFSKQTRIVYYAKQPRTKRPQFVILGVAWSKNGTKRYLVRDVNHNTKRDGQTGYITTKKAFTSHTYYQNNPKTVKMIARVNGYRDKALKHQVKNFKPGKVLHVKQLVRYRLTTRLVLRDGTFITGNKTKLIMQ